MSSRFSSSSSLGKAQTRERWTSSIRFFPGWSIASFSGNLSWWLDTLPRPFRIVCSLFFWIRLLENFFPGTVGSHLADTSLLRTPRHWRQESVPPAKRIKKWLKLTLVITDSLYYGNADTFMPPPPQRDILLFFSFAITDTWVLHPKSWLTR